MKTFPVIEIFGPTVQGEGALAGLPTLFVRFGGCDYRCSWCDSMYAVEPEEVRRNAEKLTVTEIVAECLRLAKNDGMWVTLSGGNPALMKFSTDGGVNDLVCNLQHSRYKVSVETQGSIWRSWLRTVNHLTISPKPPSSGMWSEKHRRQMTSFLDKAQHLAYDRRSIKLVVFDQKDLDWARTIMNSYPNWALRFLSAGTDQPSIEGETDDWVRDRIADRYRWLCEAAAGDPAFTKVRILPQCHVIAWGTKRGV